MRFVSFFKDLANWLYKASDLNYSHIKKLLSIMLKNMTDKEKDRYNYWFFKCLKSISTQLDITEFTKGSE